MEQPRKTWGEAAEQHRQRKAKMRKELREWAQAIIIALIITIFIMQVVLINARVPSGSMEDTILTGDRLVGLRTAYWFSEPQRGDIIIFRFPDDESELYVKRVIGLPGDTILLSGGSVYVNDTLLAEDAYLLPTIPTWTSNGQQEQVFEVPEACYFVLGDNRTNSHDSRYWHNTYVTHKAIIGKAWLRLYPGFAFLE